MTIYVKKTNIQCRIIILVLFIIFVLFLTNYLYKNKNKNFISVKEFFTNPRGENSAGKLTASVTPQYSSLTSDYGTQAKIISKNIFSKPIQIKSGINTWEKSFDYEKKLFDNKYKPQDTLLYMPNYKKRYSLTGTFTDEGPLAANAIL